MDQRPTDQRVEKVPRGGSARVRSRLSNDFGVREQHQRHPRILGDPRSGVNTEALLRSSALALHLSRREAARANRWTLLGGLWPLARQLTQLAVLVFAFSVIFDIGVPNYPLFVFSGLVMWSWFVNGLNAASGSILTGRHLALQPSFPLPILPVVALGVPLIDVVVALPVLGGMLVLDGGLPATAPLLAPLLALQLLLMAGLAWIVAAVSVYLRDVPNIVAVTLGVVFFLTPVWYPLDRVPPEYSWILELNPMAMLLEAYRAVLLEARLPELQSLGILLGVGCALAVPGYLLFRHLSPGFFDEL